MKKIVFVVIMLLLFTGCEKEASNKINMDCNGNVTALEVKKGDALNCTLLGTNFKFVVKSSTENKILFEVDNAGLSDNGSLLDDKKNFEMKKDEVLVLNTQTTDYQQKVIFSWQ